MINEFGPYEDDFQQWIDDGYPDVKQITLDYLQHLCDPEDYTQPREGTLWEHQWDALLRVIYAHEIRRDELTQPNGALLNVVTGGGKTAIIAALMVWAAPGPRRAAVCAAMPQPHRPRPLGG